MTLHRRYCDIVFVKSHEPAGLRSLALRYAVLYFQMLNSDFEGPENID